MASCCVVASAGGYPEAYKTGDVITGLESLIANRKSEIDDKSLVFICGANEDVDGSIKTNGGRILNVVGLGETLEEAQKKRMKRWQRFNSMVSISEMILVININY